MDTFSKIDGAGVVFFNVGWSFVWNGVRRMRGQMSRVNILLKAKSIKADVD